MSAPFEYSILTCERKDILVSCTFALNCGRVAFQFQQFCPRIASVPNSLLLLYDNAINRVTSFSEMQAFLYDGFRKKGCKKKTILFQFFVSVTGRTFVSVTGRMEA